ncbi:hypothetical protein [Streptomyces bobili]|uniref:hypothetical protein n=1 Tax=Streptomyces bobili TaxID=67280 RepID=UPI0038030710
MGDPRKALLQDAAWEDARTRVCRSVDLSERLDAYLDRWCRELDYDYRRLTVDLAGNPHVRIELRTENGRLRDHLVLTSLDKLTEPASLTGLREAVDARIPAVLPELLLEVHAWAWFLNHFHHVWGASSRAEYLVSPLSGPSPSVVSPGEILFFTARFTLDMHSCPATHNCIKVGAR